jgi:hypothetical protein
MFERNKHGELYTPITIKGIFNTIRYWLFPSYRKYIRELWNKDIKKWNDFFEETEKRNRGDISAN